MHWGFHSISESLVWLMWGCKKYEPRCRKTWVIDVWSWGISYSLCPSEIYNVLLPKQEINSLSQMFGWWKFPTLELQYDNLSNLLLLSVTYQTIWHCLCAHVEVHKVLIVSRRVIDCHGRWETKQKTIAVTYSKNNELISCENNIEWIKQECMFKDANFMFEWQWSCYLVSDEKKNITQILNHDLKI